MKGNKKSYLSVHQFFSSADFALLRHSILPFIISVKYGACIASRTVQPS